MILAVFTKLKALFCVKQRFFNFVEQDIAFS